MEKNLTILLDELTPFFDERLVGKEYLKSIKEIGKHLPLLSFGCFECYLNNSKRVDLNLSISFMWDEHTLTADFEMLEELIGSNKYFENFRPVLNLWQKWQNSDYILANLLHKVWIVFDIVNPKKKIIHPWYYIMYSYNPFMLDTEIKTQVMKNTLSELGINHQILTNIEQVSGIYTPEFAISSIGVQFHRASTYFRIYTFCRDFNIISNFLTTNHWQGNFDDFYSQISDFIDESIGFGVSLDYDPTLLPKIGIEFWFEEKDLESMIMKLVKKGVCEESIIDCLNKWNGSFWMNNIPNKWIFPSEYSAEEISKIDKVLIKRTTLYIKLTYQFNTPLIGKIYIYFERQGNE